MRKVVEICAKDFYEAVCEACFQANVNLPNEVYSSLEEISQVENQSKMQKIFANAFIAQQNKRPLCQDTGQVLAFVEIGENILLSESNIEDIVNKAVSDCYCENVFRKSVVKDALFERENTKTNTPAIVYVEQIKEELIRVKLLIKGGGAENMSALKMFAPTATKEEISEFVLDVVEAAGENACPPLFLGVGIGGTADYAAILSKKAFFEPKGQVFAEELKNYINQKSQTKVAGIKMLSSQTHIASLPVFVTVNCNCNRHAIVEVKPDTFEVLTEFATGEAPSFATSGRELSCCDIDALKSLNLGDEILLTGTLYSARDAAHKRLVEMIKNQEPLPFELKNSIIFYAGPCPKTENEIIGPIGPTTSKRMDKFAPKLYDMGVLATIGKGPRNDETAQSIKRNNAIYFSAQGGVASLLQSCIKTAECVAFAELGAEAIYKLEVEKLPVKVELI